MQLENNLATSTGWDIFETRFIPEQRVTTGSNYMTGNGYLGYRGTFSDDRAADFVACVVSDTYDNADGKWKELVTAPNPLFAEISVNGSTLSWSDPAVDDYRRTLNFRYGEWSVQGSWPGAGVTIVEERYAAVHDHHILASRIRIRADRPVRLTLKTGIDGKVWSLNGNHYREMRFSPVEGSLEGLTITGEHQYTVIVREHSVLLRGGETLSAGEAGESPGHDEPGVPGDPGIFRTLTVDLDCHEEVELIRFAAIGTTNDLRSTTPVTTDAARGPRPDDESVRNAVAWTLHRAMALGWDGNRTAHRQVWDGRWAELDIRIEGDEMAQTVLRYCLYHNVIATPLHADHLPIGARGLSCQAYQGAAFWDQEIFNLPMFLYTDPPTARNILVYRYRTLDGARRKARDLGYQGAYFAWVSGDTGEEICPSYFFRDLISGRRIRNHFNDWQIHISPDISYTIWKYMTVTGDREFLRLYGAEIVFEVARFLFSRVHFRPDREQYEVIRVLGPDEYHENVDNNYFTNFQTRFALDYACQVYRWIAEDAPEDYARLAESIGIGPGEATQWAHVVERILVPAPDEDTGLIEQFKGFFDLEDTRPDVIRERLVDPGEYWGWPNGIAVETQVSKQADVTQLFVLHPHACTREVMKANWEYYEPRTQHGSSLSYGVYAISAAWIGHMEDAYRYFIRSCTVDLYNRGKSVSGGTFIGGIHTAACGIAWQIVVQGFLGMDVDEGGFRFSPRLPEGWHRLTVPLQRRGQRIEVEVEKQHVRITAGRENAEPVPVRVGEEQLMVAPGVVETLRWSP